MAPNFRQNTQTRRGNRSGYVEHDDFEGLPVRQWRQEWVKVAPPPPADTTQKNDVWAIELPHGMPKDSHLLPTHTQELLRAARSGRLYKRPLPVEEEEADPDAALAEKPDKKEEEDPSTKSYQVKVWKQVPRTAEGPTISHLAKRRKGVITLSATLPAGPSSGPTITKATVRRIDAAGNPYTQEVTLNEGQTVDGEIISTMVVPAPIAAANADASTAATPVRRRPPPPKRKPKGPGRGRKKKLPLPASTQPKTTNASVHFAPGENKPSGLEVNNVKQNDHSEAKNQDSEMADDDDGDDGEDDGEEGEDGEEGDEEDSEMPDTESGPGTRAESEVKADRPVEAPSTASQMEPSTKAISVDLSTGVEPPLIMLPSPPSNLDLPSAQPPLQHTPSHFEGSPLKNVVAAITSPTESAPKLASSNGENSCLVAAVETGPTNASLESAPVPANPVELPPLVAAPDAPKPDTDVEMQDVSHQEHNGTIEQPTTDKAIEQPGDATVIPLPAVDSDQFDDVPSTHYSPPSTTAVEVPNTQQPVEEEISKTVVDIAIIQEPKTADVAPAPEEVVPAPEQIDTKVEPTIVERVEENEPESPDLFSGLEAALNQQGDPKEPSAPPEPKVDNPVVE
ncbi:hypothetical protein F4804DRAFT_292490 [Jackrogersella minutella]|nr:hypothetical protein F4804DRAFT_292490 [Jackrogersella minutella]